MATAEDIRKDIDLALRQSSRDGERGGLITRFRDIDDIEISQHRIPRHRILGNIASRPLLSMIADTEARSRLRVFWLPEPIMPKKFLDEAHARTIVVTSDYERYDALRSLYDPKFYGFRDQPPQNELLEEASGLLVQAGIDNMQARGGQITVSEFFQATLEAYRSGGRSLFESGNK